MSNERSSLSNCLLNSALACNKIQSRNTRELCVVVWPYPNFALLSLWNTAKMVIKVAVRRVSSTVKVWVSDKKWEMRLAKKLMAQTHTGSTAVYNLQNVKTCPFSERYSDSWAKRKSDQASNNQDTKWPGHSGTLDSQDNYILRIMFP